MEISKKAVFYRLEAEPSIEGKKEVLQSIISSISMLKIINGLKELEKKEHETISDIQAGIEGINKEVMEFINCLPKEESEELMPKLKQGKKARQTKETFSESRQFEEELKSIKEKLARLQ
jgi:hypothetical protein